MFLVKKGNLRNLFLFLQSFTEFLFFQEIATATYVMANNSLIPTHSTTFKIYLHITCIGPNKMCNDIKP